MNVTEFDGNSFYRIYADYGKYLNAANAKSLNPVSLLSRIRYLKGVC